MKERMQDFFWGIQDKFYDIKEKLFVSKEDQDADGEDDFIVEEKSLSSEWEEEREPSMWLKMGQWLLYYMKRYRVLLFLVIMLTSVVIGFVVYNRMVTFDGYMVAATYENSVSAGTRYRAIGKDILKYNSDGVTCVSRNNDIRWSITYSMQSPVTDVCDTTMVIAEQHGNQVFVVNEDGQLGSFKTDLPILRACVSRQGVAAVMLQEEEVTWINLYRPDGTLIASDKTKITESGYPLAMDLSPDGQRMAVSYVGIADGVLTDTVSFYHFGAAGQEEKNNLVGSEKFDGVTIPVVYYADNSHIVAVTDSGFAVFEGADRPKKSESVDFGTEIISSFHEDDLIGFVLDNEGTENRYRIEVYNLGGKQKMMVETDYNYSNIKMQNGQILIYNDKSCMAYTSSGHQWFYSNYEKEVTDFYYFSEYRKYLIITQDSFDRIRIGKQGGGES